MSKSNKRKRTGARRKRQRGLDGKSPAGSVSDSAVPMSGDNAAKTGEDSSGREGSALTQIVRAVAIAPIAFLVMFLASHPLYIQLIPQWILPILDKQVAVLTLTAGHAAIISLLINNKGRFTPSTYTLFVAGVATALAGFRTIGESTPGVVIALMLILLTFPAVWADAFSAGLRRAWRFVRTPTGISLVLLSVATVLIAYNQWQDENYIRNWILIPMGIATAFVISVLFVWQLIELSYRYVPPVFASLRTRAAVAFSRKSRRQCKGLRVNRPFSIGFERVTQDVWQVEAPRK